MKTGVGILARLGACLLHECARKEERDGVESLSPTVILICIIVFLLLLIEYTLKKTKKTSNLDLKLWVQTLKLIFKLQLPSTIFNPRLSGTISKF